MIKRLCFVVLLLTCACHSIQCYNGTLWRKVPSGVLQQLGMSLNDIVDYPSDCEKAYKAAKKLRRHVNNTNRTYSTPQRMHPVVQATANSPSVAKHSYYDIDWIRTLVVIGIAAFVIWVIKLTISCFRENTDSVDYIRIPSKKCSAETLESHEYLGVHQFRSPVKEPVKSWDDLSREYSENLRKLEQERLANTEVTTIQESVTPTYEELLRRPEWRQFRKCAFKRYGRICANCGRGECRLNIHHHYYLKDENGFVYPWKYPLSAVSILCDECHDAWHKSHKNRVYNKLDASTHPLEGG